jgi:hypothetical protein
VFAGVLVAVAWLGGASAGPNPDAQKIDACLRAAAEKGTSGVTCIGMVADPCIDAARGTNTDVKDAAACAARELAIWTTRLQRAIARARMGGSKDMAAAVTESQKSFVDSLAKLCPLYDRLDPGMAMGGTAYCRLQETAMRVLSLERLADAVNPH